MMRMEGIGRMFFYSRSLLGVGEQCCCEQTLETEESEV